jgi:hypothetical protein
LEQPLWFVLGMLQSNVMDGKNTIFDAFRWLKPPWSSSLIRMPRDFCRVVGCRLRAQSEEFRCSPHILSSMLDKAVTHGQNPTSHFRPWSTSTEVAWNTRVGGVPEYF